VSSWHQSTARLEITNNIALRNVNGLSSLTAMQGNLASLVLTGNTALIRCCGLYNLLSNNLGCDSQPGCGTVTISNNGAGCTREDILAGGACTSTASDGVAVETSDVVYPNPANNSLNVAITNDFTGTYQFAIYDMSMTIVKQGAFVKTGTDLNSQIDLQSVPKGMYILRVRRPDGETTEERLAVIK